MSEPKPIAYQFSGGRQYSDAEFRDAIDQLVRCHTKQSYIDIQFITELQRLLPQPMDLAVLRENINGIGRFVVNKILNALQYNTPTTETEHLFRLGENMARTVDTHAELPYRKPPEEIQDPPSNSMVQRLLSGAASLMKLRPRGPRMATPSSAEPDDGPSDSFKINDPKYAHLRNRGGSGRGA